MEDTSCSTLSVVEYKAVRSTTKSRAAERSGRGLDGMLPELVLSTAMQENEEKQMVLWVEYELSVVEEERKTSQQRKKRSDWARL